MLAVMPVTSVVAYADPLECVVTVDETEVARFGGYTNRYDLESFAESLVGMTVGLQGTRFLGSEESLDNARLSSVFNMRTGKREQNTAPVADLRGLEAVVDPPEGVLLAWERTDP